jgi:hypothetical protein
MAPRTRGRECGWGDRYERLDVGVGSFPGKLCEHDWCSLDRQPAAVYVDVDGRTAYLCARHFAHLIQSVSAEYCASP